MLLLLFSALALAEGPVTFQTSPPWFEARQATRVIDRIQSKLEWDLRKTTVIFNSDEAAFARGHEYGPTVVAYTRKSDSTVLMGPKVTKENFEGVFGHELGHVIVGQKYKQAIPAWLEEGLVNYVARHGKVDYAALKNQKLPPVESLSHPFKGSVDASLHYQLSTATMEFLAAKCSFADLLQLSVGKKLENFLSTYCEVSNLNHQLAEWIARH